MIAVGISIQGIEVIPEPDAVDAEGVGAPPCLPQLLDRALLGVDRPPDLERPPIHPVRLSTVHGWRIDAHAHRSEDGLSRDMAAFPRPAPHAGEGTTP